MKPCIDCFSNSWDFERLPDNWFRATCKVCCHEVEWEVATRKPTTSTGDICRKCHIPTAWCSRKLTNKRKNNAYHFCKWLKCPKCKAVYFLEEFKKYPGQPCDCDKPKEKTVDKLNAFRKQEGHYLIDV